MTDLSQLAQYVNVTSGRRWTPTNPMSADVTFWLKMIIGLTSKPNVCLMSNSKVGQTLNFGWNKHHTERKKEKKENVKKKVKCMAVH